MTEQITIRRATGNYCREVIKQTETKFYWVVLYKNVEPIWGGRYAVALFNKSFTEVKTKNGLCLDAAIEVFNQTLKTLVTT